MHYESLRFLGKTLGAHVHRRIGVLLVMLGLLVAHAPRDLGIRARLHASPTGRRTWVRIGGIEHPDVIDYMYLSSMVYATVGFGDIVPGRRDAHAERRRGADRPRR